MKSYQNLIRPHIYFDYNSTTPVHDDIVDNMKNWTRLWGNPSSIHFNGRGPKKLIRESRQKIAELVNCNPLEIIFTSGGSEANNYAIKGVLESLPKHKDKHFVCSSVEHPSVLKTMDELEKRGCKIDRVPVNIKGEIDLNFFNNCLTEKTALVSIMYANNETGIIFPIQKLCQIAHNKGILFHSDCVQSLGKSVVDLKKWEVDLASFSGHKFYSLKGCGFLYTRKGLHLSNVIHGGGQERGRRGGTENALAIASLGLMAEKKKLIENNVKKMKDLRLFLEEKIITEIPKVRINGLGSKRLPNSVSLVVEDVDGESLMLNLDIHGFSVSTGAACSSGNPEPSAALLAMGLSRREAQSSLRISLGWNTKENEVISLVETLKKVVVRLRNVNSSSHLFSEVHP